MRILALYLAGVLFALALPLWMAPSPVEASQRSRPEGMEGWPQEAVEIARVLVTRHGPPQERTRTRLIWHDNAPFKRTVLHREHVQHHFPRPHRDRLEQTIGYTLPPERAVRVLAFNGSLSVKRTAGELTIHGRDEDWNLLMLNLAHEVALLRMEVEEARRAAAAGAEALERGQRPPRSRSLLFATHPRQGFPDHPVSAR